MDFLNVFDRRESRTGGQVVLECFDTLHRAFGQCFHAAVVQILHVPNNLMARGRALRKESKPYALHVATDQKPACDFDGH